MQKESAIAILNDLAEEALEVKRYEHKLTGWLASCRSVLVRLVGPQSEYLASLNDIGFGYEGSYQIGDPTPFRMAFIRGVDTAKSVLKSCIRDIEAFGLDCDSNSAVQTNSLASPQADSLASVENLCRKFHSFACQQKKRHNNRKCFEIDDEYDVQDLLHALLKLHFEDIRPEEWTPSFGGKSGRTDFLLKSEKIVIEVKRTRDGLDEKKVGEELIIDIARYKGHPDCKTLICFVYDPEHRIKNPAGLEQDLSKVTDGLMVRVIITPKQ